MYTVKINHIIVLKKDSYNKFESNWISQVSNLNALIELQKVRLSHFPSSYNLTLFFFFFWCLYPLKNKNSQIFNYVHLNFWWWFAILKETASL